MTVVSRGPGQAARSIESGSGAYALATVGPKSDDAVLVDLQGTSRMSTCWRRWRFGVGHEQVPSAAGQASRR